MVKDVSFCNSATEDVKKVKISLFIMFNKLFIVKLIISGTNYKPIIFLYQTKVQRDYFSLEMQSQSMYRLRNNDFSFVL